MKIDKITVNKTDEQPEGVEIEIVKPESDLQGRVLSFLLASHVRELKSQGRITYDLPEQFNVEHRGEGTFVILGTAGDGDYYQSPRPVAIVGIQIRGNRFDLVHAEVIPQGTEEEANAAKPAQESFQADEPVDTSET